MIDFEKELKEMFASLLTNPDVIKEAEEEVEAELKIYRAKKQAEFERSEIYKKARRAAIQQLKEQKLSEGMASIDKEFEEKTAKINQMLKSEETSTNTKEKASIPAKKKETRRAKIKRTRKELEQETQDFVRDKTIDALFQIAFDSEMYSSDDIHYAIEQGKTTNNPEQALATAIEIALENGISLDEIRDRSRSLAGEEITDSSFNEIFDMYSSIDKDERIYEEIKARSNVINFDNPADKDENYDALAEFKGLKF